MGNDDFLFDDENFKPSLNKKASFNGPIYGGTKPDLSSEANARKRLINKSARKDILEEIFGDDLFNGFSKNNQAGSNVNAVPAVSKANPQMAKRNSIVQANVNGNGPNKFEDLFSNNTTSNANTNNKPNAGKDPFDFSLDYEPSFLKDDPSNQYNTRRSRYLPSGKRLESVNNNNNNNSAKGGAWNQAQFKISDASSGGGGGMSGGGGMGKQNNSNNSYVPSFAGSGKATDKKSKLYLIRKRTNSLLK
jgi:hypothetical protein